MAHDRNALDYFLNDEKRRLKATLDPQQQEHTLRALVERDTVMAAGSTVAFAFTPPAHIGSLEKSSLDEPDYAEALKIWLNNYFPPDEVTIRNYRRDGLVGVKLAGASAQRFVDIMKGKPAHLPDHRVLVDEVADDAHTAAAIMERARDPKLRPNGDVEVDFSIPCQQAHTFSGRLRERYGFRITFTPPQKETSPMMTLGATLHGDAAEKFLEDHRVHGRT